MFVFHNTGRLIKKGSPVLRLVGQDPVDLALSDDRIAFFSDAGVIKEFIDIPQSADSAVEQVFALTAAIDPAGNSDLAVIDRQGSVRVVQSDGNISKAKRPARLRPREDDVLHGRPAQLLDSLLTQHPPDRIRDIALSASVGAYDSGNTVVKFKFNLVCKGLEALNLNTF